MWRPILLALVAGCHTLFGLDPLPDAPPPPPPDAPATCVASEAFSGTSLDPLWGRFLSIGFDVTQDEALQITIDPSVTGEAGAIYGRRLDLVGGFVEVEVPQLVNNDPNVENYIRLRTGTSNDFGYVIRYGEGYIDFRTRVDNVYAIHSVRPYETADRFWRIENGPTSNEVTFMTKPAADAPWRVETTQPAMVAFDDLQVLLVAGSYRGGTAEPGYARFDNFAVCNARLR